MVKPIVGFRSLETHHCVTGSMLHVLRHHGVDISEEMLLGLGAGVGFFYWHMKGSTPMLLGRGNVHRPGVEGLEIDACRRLGIRAQRFVTGSRKKARAALQSELGAGRPVMVGVDIGFLPYFDFPEEYHFGGHVIVVAGLDGESCVVADRDAPLHEMPVEALEAARGSTFKPFPPAHVWYRFDLKRARAPRPPDVAEAIRANAVAMLDGPIANLGVRGIRKAARLVPRWPDGLDEATLQDACLNNFIFIDATGGTGGGMFRLMYGRFLREAAEICDDHALDECADRMTTQGRAWDEVGQLFRRVSEGVAPPDALTTLGEPLLAIAEAETALWSVLRDRPSASPSP